MVAVEFNVSVPTCVCGNKVVFLVGDYAALGLWSHEKAVELRRRPHQQKDADQCVWSIEREIDSAERLAYRYFVGVKHTLGGDVNAGITASTTVESWEGGTLPRILDLKGNNGRIIVNDVYGKIGSNDVTYPGWLTNQTEIRLQFHSDSFVKLGRSHPLQNGFRIKCLPIDLSQDILEPIDAVSAGQAMADSSILYLDIAEEMTVYGAQTQTGVYLSSSDSYVTFKTQTQSPQNLGIIIQVYGECTSGVGEESHPIGHSLVLPAGMCSASTGKLQLPVLSSDQRPCGQLSLDYVIVRPMGRVCDMAVSSALEWDHSQQTLDKGHRGMGKCRSSLVAPYFKENTIQAFNQAAKLGIDYVEMDIQLTKDLVPIVYHDFLCRIPCASDNANAFHDVPVGSMTYKELKTLKAGFSMETGISETVLQDVATSLEEAQLFPTMKEVFDAVNPHVGFFIEIKYPSMLLSGKLEDDLQGYMDMNRYLDVLLDDILRNAGERKVVLGCFNYDVCIMMRQKQNRFPVSLITQGRTSRYELFTDVRTHSIPSMFRMAKAEHFLGVNPISEYILNDLSLIQRARDLDLVMMCWGSENTDPAVLKILRDNHVHAVTFDKVDEVISPEKYDRYTKTNGH